MNRNLLITILFLVCSVNLFSQNKQMVSKSNAMFAVGVELYNEAKYKEAADIFKNLLGIDTLIWKDTRPQRIVYTAMFLGNSLYKLGRIEEAKENQLTALYYRAYPVDYRIMNEADSLSLLGKKYSENKEYKKAIELYSKRGTIVDSLLTPNHIWAANNKLILAELYQKQIRLDLDNELNKYMNNIYSVFNEETAKENAVIADSMYCLYLNGLSQYYGATSMPYIYYLVTSGDFFEKKYYSNAKSWVSCVRKGVSLLEKYYPDEHDFILQAKFNLSKAMNELYGSNYGVDLNLTNKQYNKHILWLDSIATQAIFYAKEALYGMKAEHPHHPFILTAYEHLANLYFNKVDIQHDTINVFKDINPQFYDTSTNGINVSTEDISAINSYGIAELVGAALAHNDTTYISPNVIKAIEIKKECLDWLMSEDKEKRNWNEIYSTIHDIIHFQEELHLYKECIPYAKELMSIEDNKIDSVRALVRLKELSRVYENIGDLNTSFEYLSKYYNLVKETKWVDDQKTSLIKLISLCIKLNHKTDFFDSANLYEDFKNIESTPNVTFTEREYSTLAMELEQIYKKNPNEQIGKLVEYLLLKNLELSSIEYKAAYMKSLISFYKSNNRNKDVIKGNYTLFDLKVESLLKNFLLANSSLRGKIWEYERNSILDLIRFNVTDPAYAPLVYNIALLIKGTLLSQDLAMVRAFKDYKAIDPNFSKIFDEWQNSYNNTKEHIKLERELLASTASFEYNKFLKTTWSNVLNCLNEKDCAIEFLQIPPIGEIGISKYYAAVLNKTMQKPIVIYLFDADRLSEIKKSNSDLDLSIAIWGKLSKYLTKITNIYFSADGNLHNMAIEQIPHWMGQGYMNEKFNMYRLSTTREITSFKAKNKYLSATIYGGLRFNTETEELVHDSKKYQNRTLSVNTSNTDFLQLRNGVEYLPATMDEVINIDKKLERINVKTKLFTNALGTETSFKNLSGSNVNLVHVATHGFYWTETEAEQNSKLSFLIPFKDAEDKALTRSGLLFAGANNVLMGKRLPDGVDDGILTAKEISELDLRGLDLVVLSACQTGLGEITGDGVFGLQRGFKKAGAKTLMMSLWKVDDKATQLLMSRFYSNLITGKSKIESLRDAQKYVREYETEVEIKSDNKPAISAHAKVQAQQGHTQQKVIKKVHPYQNPKYWAAFILLDALN